jgi:protein SCO1/2
VHRKTVNGQVVNDTVTATIPSFSFIDQNGHTVDTNTIRGKIYVVDFFFTHCPSICPKMKAELHKVYKYKGNGIIIPSHSIDPDRDSVAVLKRYADKLNIENDQWLFLTGIKTAYTV